MRSDDAFLSAIHANGHDEKLRLRYANWLDEQDHRGKQRAQYLRLECELVRTWWYDQQQPKLFSALASLVEGIDKPWLAAVRRCTTPILPLDIEMAMPQLRGCKKIGVRLHPRPGITSRDASKIGGVFLWPRDEPWPHCEEHDCDYVPALQLRKDDVPELRFKPGSDLFQVLWCPYDHIYCPRPQVFWRTITKVSEPRTDHFGSTGEIGVTETWNVTVPKPCVLYPERVPEYPDPFEFEPEYWNGEELDRALKLLNFGPIDRWSFPEDIPRLYQVSLSTADGTKVGGYPDWVQDPGYPKCECGNIMECIVTFSSWEYDGVTWVRWLPIQDRPTLLAETTERYAVSEAPGWMFGDAGCFYLFICHKCKDWPIKWSMQCS